MNIARFLQILQGWMKEREPLLLLSVLLLVATSWSFLEVLDEVIEGSTLQFDRWMVRAMRTENDPGEPLGPTWVQEMGRDMTALGGVGVLSLVTLVVSAYLWLDRRKRMALFVLGAAVSGQIVSSLLKQIIQRPRPDIVPQLSFVHTSSFPSGHSMLSAIIYLTLGALLAASTPLRRLKVFVLAVALLLSFLVGISRVYLGVHYPTDVLAGWMAGLIWALCCWLSARYLQRRRTVEPYGGLVKG